MLKGSVLVREIAGEGRVVVTYDEGIEIKTDFPLTRSTDSIDDGSCVGHPSRRMRAGARVLLRMRAAAVAAPFANFNNLGPHPEEPGPAGTRRLEGWPHA
jgi:hypothetical protein